MNALLISKPTSCAVVLGALALSCASTHSAPIDPQPDEEPLESVALDTPLVAELVSADLDQPVGIPMAPRLTGDGVFYVVGDDPQHPLARYSDGQLAMSNSCGIKLGNKLNRRIPPIYVNGQPIGFC